MHLSDRELLPETETAVLCATMHLQPCGIMRLACPAFFRFLFPQNQAHCLWFPQVGQETAPLGVSGCWHGSFSIYLLVTYLSAILHTCLSSTCCSPRRTTTAHKISVSVRVKSEYAAYSWHLTGRCLHASGRLQWGGKGTQCCSTG